MKEERKSMLWFKEADFVPSMLAGSSAGVVSRVLVMFLRPPTSQLVFRKPCNSLPPRSCPLFTNGKGNACIHNDRCISWVPWHDAQSYMPRSAQNSAVTLLFFFRHSQCHPIDTIKAKMQVDSRKVSFFQVLSRTARVEVLQPCPKLLRPYVTMRTKWHENLGILVRRGSEGCTKASASLRSGLVRLLACTLGVSSSKVKYKYYFDTTTTTLKMMPHQIPSAAAHDCAPHFCTPQGMR
jgi:hypothetical protein